VISADILGKLTTALARWDGRGSSGDDALHAGQELALAVMALLVWDSQQ
jgi:hypothetical protein